MCLVSVIIPTFNDDERLQLCLNALARQNIEDKSYEVIVVNNSKNSLSVNLPASNFYVFEEPRPGSYAARNLGIFHAKSDILAFTDSDCIPECDWIVKGIKALKENGLERVAGKIIVFPRGEKMSAVECYEKIFAFDQESNAKQGVSVTANLFIHRKAFNEVGLFNHDLLSAGDVEWNKRATNSGLSLKYVDDVIVYHPARHSWAELAKKIRRTTGGKLSVDQSYKLSMLRSLFPPVAAVRNISKSNESMRTKFLASFIAYRVKLEKFVAFRKLRSDSSTPEGF
ncbi:MULTISPECIES: glycosyltransferase family 2 protein [Halomonas]|uniref:GT2 family glycosyltransferase n=1 Tax=Halomonas ventosae TaxID=229007 RepID=A0A4R6I5R9_9GAMM|nr:glycosyltransferase [Halomonas ventosae]TDO16641.1 GT2 family glycosyltransferase [Halomonas ventosae]